MAFKLSLASITGGRELEAIKKLATLRYLLTLSNPITDSVMRTALQTGQFQNYSDSGWLAFLTDIAATPLDVSALTTAELSLINVILSIVSPDPSGNCCALDAPIAASVSLAASPLIGSVTFEHSMELKMTTTVDCAISSVKITLVQVGPAPAIISANPFTALFSRCSSSGRFFLYLWVEFAADPTGEEYTIAYDFRDADDNTIYSFSGASNLIIP